MTRPIPVGKMLKNAERMMDMKKVFAAALTMILVFSLAACGRAEETTYRDILLGDGEFRYNGEDVTLKTFMEGEDETAAIFYFTVMDLDSGWDDEVLLQIAASAGDAGGYLVLHQGEKGIEGFRLSPRTMWELKDDGTFVYSLAAGTEDGIASLAFEGETCKQVNHFTARGEQFSFSEFMAGESPITEEEYLAAMSAHRQKPDAQWHDFTEEALKEAFPEE